MSMLVGLGSPDRPTHNVGVNSQKEAPNTASPQLATTALLSCAPLPRQKLILSSAQPGSSDPLGIRCFCDSENTNAKGFESTMHPTLFLCMNA